MINLCIITTTITTIELLTNILKMKKLLLLLAVVIIGHNVAFGQEAMQFEKVIQVENMNKDNLYAKIHEWFVNTYRSADDVIQMSDKAEGVMIGKGSMKYSREGLAYSCYSGYVGYTLKIYVKDSRFKVVMTDFRHSIRPGNARNCELGLITDAEVYATKGMSRKYHNSTWDDIKRVAGEYSENTWASLEASIKSNDNSNDW